MNGPLKTGSGSRSYTHDCADCLLQGTPNEPPSPAPRKAAHHRKASVSHEALAFLFSVGAASSGHPFGRK